MPLWTQAKNRRTQIGREEDPTGAIEEKRKMKKGTPARAVRESNYRRRVHELLSCTS